MKYCPKCKIVRNDDDFTHSQLTKNGGWCRGCNQEYQKQHYCDNKNDYELRNAKYELENKKKREEQRNNWLSNNPEYGKLYRQNNKEALNSKKRKYVNDKYETDPKFRLRINVSASINKQLKISDSSKNNKSCLEYLPYSIQELKEHLEKQFEYWMTWDNQGKYNPKTWKDDDSSTWTWQLDHIISQANFPYTSMEDENFRKCWALENLRPLSAKQNNIDGNRKIK